MADCTCTNFPADRGNVTIWANLGIGVASVPSPLTLVKAASGAYAAVLRDGDLPEIDHVIPRAAGGHDGYANW